MTGYLRDYIPYYAQKVEPLQRRKTILLRKGPDKGLARKAFSVKELLNEPTREELDAFNQL